jgi:hypothetical protein
VEHTARLRRANHTYNSQGLVCTSGSLATVPLGVTDNGQHRLVLEAYAYYRVFEQGAWQIRKVLVERREHPFALYLPWSGDSASLAAFLHQEWHAGRSSGIDGERVLAVWGVLRTLSPSLHTTLRQAKQGAFTECNIFGVCAVVPPARIRLLNDSPTRFLNLVDVGCLRGGGLISACQRPRDGRVSDVGSRIAGGMLLVEGLRHGYLLLGPGVETSGDIQVIELPRPAMVLLAEIMQLGQAFASGRELRP